MTTVLSGARAGMAWRFSAVAAASLLVASCGGGGGGGDDSGLQIRSLSNRADLVSGGDALLEISTGAGITPASLKVTAEGRDVTSAFTLRDGKYVGLVTGLASGNNTIVAESVNARAAQLVVTNAPRSGPILSGNHVTPFYCATPAPVPGNGTTTPTTNASGLSGQPDANCNIPSETFLYYRSTLAAAGCSTALPNPTPSPTSCWRIYTPGTTYTDIANTTTDHGQTVPFIVRVERGTMNRGLYDVAVLFNPAQPWTAAAPQPQWNGKVYYTFGSSTGQPRKQARPQASWSGAEEQLKRGYLWVTNSMSDSARNSNRVLMSETVMMMKEHIGDTYGPIKFTLGTGCSGGSINANMNASINPGLLDGIVTQCTYPDSETTTLEVGDCVLLVEAYQKPALTGLWAGLTQPQINAKKAAINGHVDQSACHGWYNAFGSNGRAGLYNQRFVTDNVTGTITQSPTPTNNCELPNTAVYDPKRPAETASLPRCNAWSWAENIWGKVPGSPAARDTRDNVGVQYGLKALLSGAITPEEFVALNETVGGIDRDSEPRAQRSTADAEALDIAYKAGIVASGKNLAKLPIIDLRGWDDSSFVVPPGTGAPGNPIHHQWFSWAVRDRIARDAGDANNQALWRFASGLTAPAALANEAFLDMDKWLTALVATQGSGGTIEARVRSTRPLTGDNETRDFCLIPGDASNTRIYDMAQCDANAFLKPSLSPRQVAGGPRAEDVLKCQLKPLNRAEYTGVTFTDPQWGRLQTVFSTGVCDWTKPGVGQQAAVSPLTFKAGPGGQPMAAAPTSQPR